MGRVKRVNANGMEGVFGHCDVLKLIVVMVAEFHESNKSY